MIGKPTSLNTFIEHARQNQLIAYNKTKKETLDLPVCPKCERAGFRHKGWREHKIMVCPHCHYEGPTTMIVRTYISKKLYK